MCLVAQRGSGHHHPKPDPLAGKSPQTRASSTGLVEEGGFTGTGPLALQGLSPPYCGLCSHWVHGSGRVCPTESRFTWEKLCQADLQGSANSPSREHTGRVPAAPHCPALPNPMAERGCPVWAAGGPTQPWAMTSFLPHRQAAAGSPSVGTGVVPRLHPGPVAHNWLMTTPLLGVKQPSPPSSLTWSPVLARGTPFPFLAASSTPGPGPNPPGSVLTIGFCCCPASCHRGPAHTPSWASRRLQLLVRAPGFLGTSCSDHSAPSPPPRLLI